MDKVNSEVYADISIIISMMPLEMKSKVSNKFIEFVEKNKSYSYISNIDPKIPLKQQYIRKETKELLGILYRDYFCEDEERIKLLKEESREIEMLNAKKNIYTSSTIKENDLEENKQDDNKLEQYKESIIKRIITKIKRLFFHSSKSV